MNFKLGLKSAAIFAVGVLLLAGNASAQWSGSIKVSGTVEPGPGGQNMGGVTTARCGSNVVVGFGDTEAGNNRSFAGYAASSNGGGIFRDFGVLPVSTADSGYGTDELGDRGFGGPTVDHDLSLACASPSLFYYAAPYLDNNHPTTGCNPICSAISVSISRNGGTSWDLPVLAASAFSDNHFLDFPSVAVDPTNPQRLYVAYLDMNNQPLDFIFPDCQGSVVTELRLARSTDGGKTWTSNAVDHVCDISSNLERQGFLGAPKVAVSPGGKVYLTYEFQPEQSPNAPLPNEIRFTRSLDNGVTFSTPIVVSKHAINNALPQVAVDRTSSTHRIYLTWSGSPTGSYTDVLMSDSLNYGLSFSFARPISTAPTAGTGRFQTNPVIAVDNDGQVVDCFYATPSNKPTSSSVYAYDCATSLNHAASWTVQRLVSSAPVGYDAVTSDFLLHNDGFFAAFELQTSGQRYVFAEKSDNR